MQTFFTTFFDRRAHHQALLEWLSGPARQWLFVGKMLLAMTLAYWVSMFLELASTRSAALTVLIVMQPQAGQVFTKSIARLIGTVFGLAASLILTALFHQQPVMFLLGTAVWCGICITGAVRYRDMRSYSYLLAGYTVGMIGIPGAISPDTIVMTSLGRMLSVTVGIICGGLVSALVFPGTSESAFKALLARRLSTLCHHCAGLLRDELTSEDCEQVHLNFAAEAVATGALRQAASMENPQLRQKNQQLIAFNQHFMALGTRWHALARVYLSLDRHRAGFPVLHDAFQHMTQPLLELLDVIIDDKISSERFNDYGRRFDVASLATRLAIRDARQHLRQVPLFETLSDGEQHHLSDDFETLAELLFRFTDQLRLYCEDYAALSRVESSTSVDHAPGSAFKTSYNPLYATTCGLRTALVILVMALLWYLSGWVNGTMFIQSAVIGSMLSATSPAPHRTAVSVAQGAGLGYIIGFFITFLVLPQVDGFPLMMMAEYPIFIIGTLLTFKPKYAGVGLGAMINFCFISSPSNPAQFLPHQFSNDALAGALGMAVAAALLSLMFPPSGRWLSRSLLKDMRRLVATAVTAPLPYLKTRIDSQCRDLLNQTYSITTGQITIQRHLLNWYASVEAVSHAVIELREQLQKLDDTAQEEHHAPWRNQLNFMGIALIRLYVKPSPRNHRRAIRIVNHALATMRRQLEPETVQFETAPRRQTMSYLHFIQASLIDRQGPFAEYLPRQDRGFHPVTTEYAS